jgi:CheY-like chemotaxis protein
LRAQSLHPLFGWTELARTLSVALGTANAQVESGVTTPPAETPQPRKILLVEDCLVNREVAVGLLEIRGHAVTTAATGRDALETLRQEIFDVVLMDLELPDMNGLEATRLFRQWEIPGAVRTPVIAMTAHAQQGYEAICLAAGMNGYITKPIDPPLLYSAVERTSHAVGDSLVK